MKLIFKRYTYSELKWLVKFVRKQIKLKNNNLNSYTVKDYIKNRAEFLDISNEDSLNDLIASAMDWEFDCFMKNNKKELCDNF